MHKEKIHLNNTCLNCNGAFEGKYCNNCGQATDTHLINIHFLWHDIQHGLFHFDKGLLYTAKELFIRPGNTIREFIEGKRVQHFKPFSFIIIMSALYGLLYHFSHIKVMQDLMFHEGTFNGYIDVEKANEWVISHVAWIKLYKLPLMALGSYIAFRKYGYNYVEHLVINAFLSGQILILYILMFPLNYFFYFFPTLDVDILTNIESFICVIFIVLTYMQFFKTISRFKALILSLSSFGMYYTLMKFSYAGMWLLFTYLSKQH